MALIVEIAARRYTAEIVVKEYAVRGHTTHHPKEEVEYTFHEGERYPVRRIGEKRVAMKHNGYYFELPLECVRAVHHGRTCASQLRNHRKAG